MKLAVFGATGRTGKHVVELALAAGHEVVALARNPAKLEVEHERLKVIQGDIENPQCVEAVVMGADAVISVLGPSSNEPTFTISKGTQHILDAMKKHGVRRLVVSAGAGVGDPNDEPKLFNKLINVLLKLVSRNVYEDMKRVVEIVRGSDRDWTVVRVPMLTNDPPKGRVKVAWVGKGIGTRLSRVDMADFIVRQVNDQTYLRQAPAISN
jgi:nucleoside-diphosphate-sugar epimerase